MFDTDGNGTIWQHSEMRPILKELCGNDHNDCYKSGMETFFEARGDKADGVQYEEVVAWFERERIEELRRNLDLDDPKSIMKTFDTDGNGTIWQHNEMRPVLEEICGGTENDCYADGMKSFFEARGEKGDGVQYEEVVAWVNKRNAQKTKMANEHKPPPPTGDAAGPKGFSLVASSTFCRKGEKERKSYVKSIDECIDHVKSNFGDVPGFMYSKNENCDPCFSIEDYDLAPFGPDSVFKFEKEEAAAPWSVLAKSTFCRDGSKERKMNVITIEECVTHVKSNFGDVPGFMYSANKNCDPCFSISPDSLGPFGPDTVYSFGGQAPAPKEKFELIAKSTFCRDGSKERKMEVPTIEMCFDHVTKNFGKVPGFMYSVNKNCDPCFSITPDTLGPFDPDSVYMINH